MRDIPTSLPALPESHVLLGWGGEFTTTGRSFAGHTLRSDRLGAQWQASRALDGGGLELVYCVPLDSPLLDLNRPIVETLNPGLAPVAASTQVAEPAPPSVPLFHLSFNGVPMASREAFEALVIPLLSTLGNAGIADIIWNALAYDDPESRVAAWAEREPVILAGIDFHPIPQGADPVDVLGIAQDTRSIGEIITRAAAGVLLRGGLSNHFRYLETGELAVVPENPPSLDQGYEIIRRTLEIRETGQKLDNYSAWTLGMLGDALERLFGDDFDPTMVMQSTGKALNTYSCAVGTFRALWANRRNLSFTHHKEAYYSKVAPEQKDWILDTADALRLTVDSQRKLTSHVRLYGTEGLAADMPTSGEELLERIEVRSVNKNYLFFLTATNKWYEYRGPFELIPNGASPIFNADTRARLSATGLPEKLDTWTPVGAEIPALRGHGAVLARNRAEALPLDAEVARSTGGNPFMDTPVEDMAMPDMREPIMEAVEAPAPPPVDQVPQETPETILEGLETPPASVLTTTDLDTMYAALNAQAAQVNEQNRARIQTIQTILDRPPYSLEDLAARAEIAPHDVHPMTGEPLTQPWPDQLGPVVTALPSLDASTHDDDVVNLADAVVIPPLDAGNVRRRRHPRVTLPIPQSLSEAIAADREQDDVPF